MKIIGDEVTLSAVVTQVCHGVIWKTDLVLEDFFPHQVNPSIVYLRVLLTFEITNATE